MVVVHQRAGGDPARAAALARELGVELVRELPGEGVALVVTAERLELQQLGSDAPGAIAVEWATGAARYRRLHGQQRGSTLARAVGLKGTHAPDVVDATAGLGRDSFVLACLGCHVRAIERSAPLFAMLEDAWERGSRDPEVGPILRERLQLLHADARELLANLAANERPEVVLVDPMFPPRRKDQALVKKEMRVTRLVTGDDPDARELVQVALQIARRRVVVKRPRGAEPLGGRPTATYEGKTTRFDCYHVSST